MITVKVKPEGAETFPNSVTFLTLCQQQAKLWGVELGDT